MGVTLTRIYKQTAEDPYASMEKDQLISMIHFLVKREDERAQENQELKDMVKDLRDTHKQDVKTQTNLLMSIDRLTNQVADLTTQNRINSRNVEREQSQSDIKAIMQGRTDYERSALPLCLQRTCYR